MRHIPNILTIFRLVMLPFILMELAAGRRHTGLPLLIVSGSTDAIDGYLARKFHWESKLGAILDPIADKLLLVGLFLAFAWEGSVPKWLAALVVGRDVLLLLGAALLFRKLKEFPPSKWGKWSTIIQGITVLAVVFHVWTPPFFAATAAITVVSGTHYVYRTYHALRKSRDTGAGPHVS